MGLTVQEKEHFKIRLRERAEQLCEAAIAADPTWERDLVKDAQRLAEKRFEVTPILAKIEKLREQKRKLSDEIETAERELIAHMTGRCADDCPAPSHNSNRYGDSGDDFRRYPDQARTIIRQHCERELRTLRANHPVGKKLAKYKEKQYDHENTLAVCANHKELAAAWKTICADFDILAEEETGRHARKVDTTRNSRAKKED